MSAPNVTRPGGRSRPGRCAALLTATAVTASLLSAPFSPATAAEIPAGQTAAPDIGPLLPGAEPVAVTLITGDTVLWSETGNGSPQLEIDEAPRGYPVYFDRSGTPEDYYVIPTDAMAHVVDGELDEELFNIPGLIRQGLDDASTDELPVIVTFGPDRTRSQLARDADQLPATGTPRPVDRINGAGVTIDRGHAAAFRRAVLGSPDRTSSPRAAATAELGGAIERIALDQALQIDLAESVPQIGAPTAWEAGYTGAGVTVAVLDTGVDTTHPDLQGQVVAEANFTDEPDASDTHGHGTHVASTIAGTGAASDGIRKGVAPDADLLSGKVCNMDGDCLTSWIMAGMQWAADQGADVVNMSLGGGATDGTDPLSQLLNQLSAETGTLFVTSAGNVRSSIRAVGAPAAADAALAVGAVDKSDQRGGFSSRGPRVGDHAVKPEITAPGVGIVAARADGTSLGTPVDDDYTSSNGTSMAAPHVTGAAALLTQATGLSGAALKDALVSTAADGGMLWYEQGTGRVDVPAALASPVYATSTVNLGGFDGQATGSILYTNRTAEDITLTLRADVTNLHGEPVDDVSLSTDAVVIPAQGNATVTVTATIDGPSLAGNEAFGGVITATAPDGTALRTGIGYGPPLHRITIHVLDSKGQPIGSNTAPDWEVLLTNDTPGSDETAPDVYRLTTADGTAVGHLPTGIYTILTITLENEPEDPLDFTRSSLLVEAEVEITDDSSITLDARKAVPIEVSVPRKADKRNHGASIVRDVVDSDQVLSRATLGGNWPLYAAPSPPGKLAPISLLVSWTLAQPKPLQPLPWRTDLDLCAKSTYRCYSEPPAYIYNLPILYENGIPTNLHRTVRRSELVEIPTRFHSDYRDSIVEQVYLPATESVIPDTTLFRMSLQPGATTEYFLADDRITWRRSVTLQRRPQGAPRQLATLYSDDRFPAIESGSRRAEERWFEGPIHLGTWDVREETLANTQLIQRWAAGSRAGPNNETFIAPFQAIDNTRGHGATALFATWRMWNADTGTELDGSGPFFPLAGTATTYSLEQVTNLPTSLPLVTGREATTIWTFTSRKSDANVPLRYRCPIEQAPRENVCQIQPLIRLEYDLGLDVNNRTPAGRAHRFTITAGQHSKAVNRSPVTSLTVQASFDDGSTWHDARVIGEPRETRETGGLLPAAEPYQQYRVVLMIPPLHRTTGFVGLRVQATDANHGTVTQTIPHAYLLK